jgi:hypothetical protein
VQLQGPVLMENPLNGQNTNQATVMWTLWSTG